MTDNAKEIWQLTGSIKDHLLHLYELLNAELSRPDKSFDIEYNGYLFKFSPACTIEEKLHQNNLRNKLITELMHEAFMNILHTLHDEEEYDLFDHWKFIRSLVAGEDPREHQYEIVKEEIVPNLDENGKPITAKDLNHESVYIQWQDERKFLI